jgi:anti-anti-sigma regulatory factor
MLLLRTEGRIFFANAEHLGRKAEGLIASAAPQVVVLDLSGVFDIEYTALKMLTAAENKIRADGRVLCLTGLNPRVLELVRRSPLGAALGRERMLFDLEHAVTQFRNTAARQSNPTAEPRTH